MTLTLDPRTNVSGVAELLQIRQQLENLTTRRAEVASHIAEDAEFMGGRVIQIPNLYFRRDDDKTLGTVFHVAEFEQEGGTRTADVYDAHPAHDCPVRRRVFWCGRRRGEKVRVAYTREPNRSWHTFLGSWVLVAHDHQTQTATLVAIQEATA